DILWEQFIAWADRCDQVLTYQEEERTGAEPVFTDDTEQLLAGSNQVIITDATEAAKFQPGSFCRIEYDGINQVAPGSSIEDLGNSRYRVTLVRPALTTYPEGWSLFKITLGDVVSENKHQFDGIFDG